LPDERPTVRQPLSIEKLIHPLEESLAVSGVRTPDVPRLYEEGRSAPEGEVAEGTLFPKIQRVRPDFCCMDPK
jgi:hypothetical protein